ncbi:mucin-2-like [Scylla paramamosain]|uniref:mucin-2-like n=1 Tax=Scylla paramamosain TaxID=85552 RepID=UPI003082DA62
MSGSTVASTLTLVVLACLGVSSVCQDGVEPSPSDATTGSVVLTSSETRLLTFKTHLTTQWNTISHTLVLFPTCTTAAQGVSSCEGSDHFPDGIFSPTLTTTAVATPTPPHVSGESETVSTTANVVEAVLPSCDCGQDTKGRRTPRILPEEDIITIHTTFQVTTTTILTHTAPVTVSITYDGCVPADAISTTSCLASPTTLTISSIDFTTSGNIITSITSYTTTSTTSSIDLITFTTSGSSVTTFTSFTTISTTSSIDAIAVTTSSTLVTNGAATLATAS